MGTKAPISTARNKYHEEAKEFCIYTPLDVSYFIYDLVRGYKFSRVLDVCCGEGNLSKPFEKSKYQTIGIDIRENLSFSPGEFINANFIKTSEECASQVSLIGKREITGLTPTQIEYLKLFNPELVISNPPFNDCPGRKLYPFEVLKKIIEIYGHKKPIVLFTLMGFRLNRRYGAERETDLERLFENGLDLTSIISMPIDAFFPGSKSKGQQWEILIFNMPGLKPHYWYTLKTRNNMIKKYGLD